MPGELRKMKNIKYTKIIGIAIFISIFNAHNVLAQNTMQELNFNNSSDSQSNVVPVSNPNPIQALEQNLKQNPLDFNTRINLARAYISQGTALYNSRSNLVNAANSFRNAIYYLKYDINIPPEQIDMEDINTANTGLAKVLSDQNISLEPKSRLNLARELRGQGCFKEAIVEFNEALPLKSSDSEIFESMGDIMTAMQNFNKAVGYYEQALSINAASSSLHLKFARALGKIGNNETAAREYNIALNTDSKNSEIIEALENIWRAKIQENPDDATAHMNLGVVLQKKEDYSGAFAQYNIAQNIEPSNITIRLNIGTLFQAQKNYTMAIQAYNSILQVNPNDIMAHYYLGTALQQTGNIQDALGEFQYTLRLDPNNILAKTALFETVKQNNDPEKALEILSTFAKNNPGDALAQYNYAYELHTRKMYDDALVYYQKTISIDPDNIDAYLNMASIFREKQQYNDADTVLHNAIAANPDNKKLKDMLNQVNDAANVSEYQDAAKKYENKDYQGAIDSYLQIIKSGDADSDTYAGLGMAYQANNNLDKAIESYNKAIELNNSNSNAIYYLGTAFYAKNDYAKAHEYFEKAITLDPKNKDIIQALNDLKSAQVQPALDKGLKYYDSKQYKQALLSFNYSQKLDPDNGYPYYYKGLVYDALKQYRLAIENYAIAVKKSGDLNVAYYSLAIDYDILKDRFEAKKAYSKFISSAKDENDQYLKYAKERIKQL